MRSGQDLAVEILSSILMGLARDASGQKMWEKYN
jgi:hypothetical protein